MVEVKSLDRDIKNCKNTNQKIFNDNKIFFTAYISTVFKRQHI